MYGILLLSPSSSSLYPRAYPFTESSDIRSATKVKIGRGPTRGNASSCTRNYCGGPRVTSETINSNSNTFFFLVGYAFRKMCLQYYSIRDLIFLNAKRQTYTTVRVFYTKRDFSASVKTHTQMSCIYKFTPKNAGPDE